MGLVPLAGVLPPAAQSGVSVTVSMLPPTWLLLVLLAWLGVLLPCELAAPPRWSSGRSDSWTLSSGSSEPAVAFKSVESLLITTSSSMSSAKVDRAKITC